MLTRSCPTHFMERNKAEDLGRQIKPAILSKKTGQDFWSVFFVDAIR